jgi:hypothetical protein
MVGTLADGNARFRRYRDWRIDVSLMYGKEIDPRKEQEELLEDEMERCLEEVRLLRRKLV